MENADSKPQLYAARTHIYPRSVSGTYRRLKWAVVVLAYGVYFLLPWLRWEREVGADQAVLFDLAGRKFYLFDLVVHPQDIFWLAGLLMIAAYLLFFVTGLAGRVFCGYFCFQTLWTDVYILIERLVQGERPARIRLANQAWNATKLIKLGLTHLLWLLMAFVTGLTFVLYWGDAPQLVGHFFVGEAPFAAYATTLFLTATTYVMAGVAREQVCTYMCPYARFQAVMFDRDTLIVSYDGKRGEGKKGRAKLGRDLKTHEQRSAAGVGDCIDCGYCVQVCPTGIDIRNGLQIQCISCALCIDACDTIMDSLGWQKGLVGYSSQRVEEGGQQARLLRPKVLGYAAVLLLAVGLLGWSVSHQAPFDLTVSQVRQPIYTQLSDGRIQNSYEIKVNNKTDRTLTLRFRAEGLPPGAELDLGRFSEVALHPEQRLRLAAKVRAMPTEFDGESHPFDVIAAPDDASGIAPVAHPSVFYVPPR
ncbi:MAG: cytochrome c oxidase accessory protein CcoG [Gammaproteobacteria bacterium]|nr:cytochrome c oxidase accessory protein CcoG [Gammaproteobacteria bacterium]